MKKKVGATLATVPRGRAASGEDYASWRLASLEELELRYGSIEAAGARYRILLKRSDFFEMPMERAPIWWATEPGVPDDLRLSKWPTDREPCWIGLLPRKDQDRIRALEKAQWEWLRESGLASADEIRRSERYAHLRVTP